ncbi:MAG: hypothetical protein AVDCRST_MAG19-4231, partial [uncultured Thermomicrobiales bacterium]
RAWLPTPITPSAPMMATRRTWRRRGFASPGFRSRPPRSRCRRAPPPGGTAGALRAAPAA